MTLNGAVPEWLSLLNHKHFNSHLSMQYIKDRLPVYPNLIDIFLGSGLLKYKNFVRPNLFILNNDFISPGTWNILLGTLAVQFLVNFFVNIGF